MPVFGAFKSRATSKGSGSSDPLTLALKTLDIQESVFAAQNDGVTVNDPMQLQQLIDSANQLSSLVKDDSDKLKLQGNIAKWEAQKSKLGRVQDVSTIGDALKIDTRDARYQYFSKNVSNPLGYLKDFASSYSVLQSIGQTMFDQLMFQNRTQEANSLKKIFTDNNDIINTYQKLESLYNDDGTFDESQTENYAVVYTTDLQGRVGDMKVLKANDVPSGYVALSNSDGSNKLMNGLQVWINTQQLDGKNKFMLGNISGDVKTFEATQINPDTLNKENVTMDTLGTLLNQQGGAKVAIVSDDAIDLDNQDFRTSLKTSDPIVNTAPGQYFTFSDGRVFRNNGQGKIDEISQDALKYFSDYNPQTTIRLSSLDSNTINGRSGKYLTQKDLFPMTSISGQPIFNPTPTSVSANGPMSMNQQPQQPQFPQANTQQPMSTQQNQSVATNRGQQMTPYSGQEKFNMVTKNMFTGNPAPR